MNMNSIMKSMYAPFFPSGTNPLYPTQKLEEVKPRTAEQITRINPTEECSETNYSRDATIRTRERGTSIDILV
jgi:hypothetical protein